MGDLLSVAKKAKNASYKLASISTETKNLALKLMADNLDAAKKNIFEANELDLQQAKNLVVRGELSKAAFGRLKLDENKFRDMVDGIRDVIKLPDPVNKKLWAMKLDDELDLYKVSCPIGVIGVIFEARPDVIAQISSLAVKSSNAVLLKGGKESVNTNKAICAIIEKSLYQAGLPDGTVNQIFSREDVSQMLKLEKYVDLIIPRGGSKLVKYIKENTKIAVLGHSDGICHIYVDKMADWDKAIPIIIDAKTQYPTACNAVETVLVHKDIYKEFVPILITALKKNEVKIYAEPELCAQFTELIPMTETWAYEYSDLALALKIVDNELEAIEHINTYGSGHTDCVITEDNAVCELFMNLVDSAGVYCNASTRFADGFRYGFGAEVGISTNKTHARGPVGLEGLTIYKYKLFGCGQVVRDYVSGTKSFRHEKLD